MVYHQQIVQPINELILVKAKSFYVLFQLVSYQIAWILNYLSQVNLIALIYFPNSS